MKLFGTKRPQVSPVQKYREVSTCQTYSASYHHTQSNRETQQPERALLFYFLFLQFKFYRISNWSLLMKKRREVLYAFYVLITIEIKIFPVILEMTLQGMPYMYVCNSPMLPYHAVLYWHTHASLFSPVCSPRAAQFDPYAGDMCMQNHISFIYSYSSQIHCTGLIVE